MARFLRDSQFKIPEEFAPYSDREILSLNKKRSRFLQLKLQLCLMTIVMYIKLTIDLLHYDLSLFTISVTS
jgi:predicted nucleic acid-binding Zn ribbon protein